MLYEFSGVVMSDLNSIKGFLDNVLYEITNYITDDELMFDIRLILNELIINGALHGNNAEKSRLVKLEIYLRNDMVEIAVEDEGNGIECELGDYNPQDLSCCGRGLLIVEKLSDKFLIDRNRFIVTKNII